MALSPFIVHVLKKPGLSFGEIMCDARFWLDRHQIEAISFQARDKRSHWRWI